METNTLSAEYSEALAASRIAASIFSKAQADYRSRKIGDVEFLAARAQDKAAQLAFDTAFAKETANN